MKTTALCLVLSCAALLLPVHAGQEKKETPAPESKQTAKEPSPQQLYDQAVKLLNGKEVPQNPAEAVRLLTIAGDKGHVPSMILVSSCCIEGIGTRRDPDAGLQIMKMAADKGSAEAQRKLAMLFNEGIAGPRDPRSAHYWFKKAADNNDPLAIYYLGTFYSQGLIVKHDPAKAFELFIKASYMNEPHAQTILSGCYVEGFGTGKDLAEAYAWALVAADNGLTSAKNQLYPFMPQKSLDKARPRAVELKKKIAEQNKKKS